MSTRSAEPSRHKYDGSWDFFKGYSESGCMTGHKMDPVDRKLLSGPSSHSIMRTVLSFLSPHAISRGVKYGSNTLFSMDNLNIQRSTRTNTEREEVISLLQKMQRTPILWRRKSLARRVCTRNLVQRHMNTYDIPPSMFKLFLKRLEIPGAPALPL